VKRNVLVGGVLVVVLAAVGAALAFRKEGGDGYDTTPVRRGDVADVVGATGTVEAVTTVQVGSQVSGTVANLYADFNTMVKKDTVVARLDPSLFEARVAQAEANLVSARANVEKADAALEDARQKYERAKQLSAEQLLPASDLETAQANYESARAGVRSAKAAVSQAAASVNQARVDLGHTVIRAPIDGVVVARNVDVGQTVAASLQAPVLFVIANDLTRIQVKTAVSEADVGRVHAGQEVSFRVDAYPDDVFRGRVQQVRLQPTVEQNVVTYSAIIGADNPAQRLLPGMTATVSVVVEERQDVLVVPSAALRFRPPTDTKGGARGERAAASPGAARAGAGRAPGAARRPAGTAEGGAGGRRGLVFVSVGGKLEGRRVVLGLSDGQVTEVREGLQEGETVVVGLAGDAQRQRAAGSSPGTNPFSPSVQRRQR
jgi:HlyD family secretion protein